jgi:hypothetical protein
LGKGTKPSAASRATISSRQRPVLATAAAAGGAVGGDHLDEGEQPPRRPKHRQDAVPIPDVGRMDHRRQQQAERVDQYMPLLALDLLAPIVAARVGTRPPFSAPLTLWLSTIAAVGLASLPARSRTRTNRA